MRRFPPILRDAWQRLGGALGATGELEDRGGASPSVDERAPLLGLCSQRTEAMDIRCSVQLCYTLRTILRPNPDEGLSWAARLSSIVRAARFVALGYKPTPFGVP